MEKLGTQQICCLFLVVVAMWSPAQADWIETFDGGFDNVWLSGDLPGTSGTGSFSTNGSYLTVTDSTPANSGGSVVAFGVVNEVFTDVRVTGTLNPGAASNMNAHLSLGARVDIGAVTAYSFGVDWFNTPGVPRGFVFLTRTDGPAASEVYLDTFSNIADFSLTDSLFLEFLVVGTQLTGHVYDTEGGNLLASLSATDSTYASGTSGVAVSSEDPSLALLGTFDNVSSTAVPEPSSMALLGFASIGCIAVRRHRRRVTRTKSRTSAL